MTIVNAPQQGQPYDLMAYPIPNSSTVNFDKVLLRRSSGYIQWKVPKVATADLCQRSGLMSYTADNSDECNLLYYEIVFVSKLRCTWIHAIIRCLSFDNGASTSIKEASTLLCSSLRSQ